MCQTVHLHDLPTDVEELVLDMIHEEDFYDDQLLHPDGFCFLEEDTSDINETMLGSLRRVTEFDSSTRPDVPPLQIA